MVAGMVCCVPCCLQCVRASLWQAKILCCSVRLFDFSFTTTTPKPQRHLYLSLVCKCYLGLRSAAQWYIVSHYCRGDHFIGKNHHPCHHCRSCCQHTHNFYHQAVYKNTSSHNILGIGSLCCAVTCTNVSAAAMSMNGFHISVR